MPAGEPDFISAMEIPEPSCVVPYAGMTPIRFSGSRIQKKDSSDLSLGFNILGTPTS
jgi:hypothetical protein